MSVSVLGAPFVAERHVVEPHAAPRVRDGDRAGRVLDVRLLVEQIERDLQVDELILERADRAADRLERLVDRSDVGDDDQQLSDRQLLLQHEIRAVAEHHRRPDVPSSH